jgi:NADPH:quinone reductase-like Zn-dependent oxidoreductase
LVNAPSALRVTDLAGGDAVFGVTDRGIERTYAEKIAIKAAIVCQKPARLGHAGAAAMALTDHTTLWAIADTAHLKPGETIQIQGGAGGVAAFGIQLAKHLGAAVITTASAGNHPARTLPSTVSNTTSQLEAAVANSSTL